MASSGPAPLVQGGQVKDREREALMFISSTLPVIHDNTIVVAATHPNVRSGCQKDDGWFLSDFYAFNYLLKGEGLEQTWLTAADPQTLIEKNGEYLHGNPYETRKVVLSTSLLDTDELTPVTAVKTAEMIDHFLQHVQKACETAKRANAPLLLMVFCHGLPNYELLLDNGTRNKGLSITRLRAVLDPAVSVCLMTTACYSGGWAVCPDFNHTTLAAGSQFDDESGMSTAWPNSASVGRACGSIFANTIVESLSSASSPLLEQPGDSRESLQPEEPNKRQTMTFNSFCHSIWNVCQARVYRLWDTQAFTFSAQDDQWEYSWTGRTGIPLAHFEERWNKLATVSYTGSEEARDLSNPSPFNQSFASCGPSMTAGHSSDDIISHQIVRIQRLKEMARLFHQTCPGDWNFGQEVGLGGRLRGIYECEEMDDASETFSMIRFRVELAILTDQLVTRFSLPLPQHKNCLSWRRVDWQMSMKSRLPDWVERNRANLGMLREHGFNPKPAQGQGPVFHRPIWYLSACLIELNASRDATLAKVLEICRYYKSIRDSQEAAVSADQSVRRTGREWIKSLGQKVRRSLSPTKRLSAGSPRRGLFR